MSINRTLSQILSEQSTGLTFNSAMRLSAGSVSLPALYFSTDTGTGLYRIGSNNLGLTINGTKLMDFSSAAVAITGTLTTSGKTTVNAALDVNPAFGLGVYVSPATDANGTASVLRLYGGANQFTNRYVEISCYNNTGSNVNEMIFKVGNVGTILEAMKLAYNGAVTIPGTLGVTGASNLTGTVTVGTSQNTSSYVNITNTNAGASADARLDLTTNASSALTLQAYGSGASGTFFGTLAASKLKAIFDNSSAAQSSGMAIGTVAALPLSFGTSNAVRMTIDSAGAITIPGTLGVTGDSTVGGRFGVGAAASATYPLNLVQNDNNFIRLLAGNSRVWRIGATGANATAGTFSLIDDSAGLTRLSVDYLGAVTIPGTLGVSDNVTITKATLAQLSIAATGNPSAAYMSLSTNSSERWRVGVQSGVSAWSLYALDGTADRFTVTTAGAVSIPGTLQCYGLLDIGTADINIGYSKMLSILAPATTAGVIIQVQGAGYPCVANWSYANAGDNTFQYFYVNAAGDLKGSIAYNRAGNVIAYNTTSDATLKNLIGDAPQARSLEILSQTRLREYSWKSDETNKPQIGVIAQELVDVFPGAVSVGGDLAGVDKDGNPTTKYHPWSVDKTAYQFHLVAGWQSHEAKIAALEARLAALEAA